jgi:hypothetical protein
MWRPEKHHMELPRQIGVVLIPPLASEQPRILEPSYRLADTELDHHAAL